MKDIENKENLLKILKLLYKARFTDEKMNKLVKQNKGTTFFLSANGHEMIGLIAAQLLKTGKDWAFPYYRDRAFVISLGSSLLDIFGSFLARDVVDHSGGRMMPDHFSSKRLNIPCQSSCVGSQYLQAVGIARGIQDDSVVYVSGGDGSTSQGDFHEALNFSALHKLPIIFVVQDNNWAISVPKKEQTAGGSIAKIAKGYENLKVFQIDGTNHKECFDASFSAIDRARKKEGPSVIVAKVPRLGAHSNSDDPTKYKDEKLVLEEKKKDPLILFENFLLENNIFNSDELNKIKEDVFKEVEENANDAENLPFLKEGPRENEVFKEFSFEEEKFLSEESIVMVDALNKALKEEMQRDKGVIVFGEDVAKNKGGVFQVTKDLTKEFGGDRCFNSPLAESTIVGMAIGLAQNGFHKPVIEIQFADYFFSGANQLLNELGSIYYRSNSQWNCPLVIRMPYGGYIQGGPYHSQSIETYLCHAPGLKVAIPSNAEDAKRLLKTAIRDPNPVIFLEHKGLYRQRNFVAKDEPVGECLLEFGKGKIVHEGADVTLVCYGMMVMFAKEIALLLGKEGISIEVIDLRTLVPWDRDLVIASVKKTSKLMVLHEASKTCGFGAEIAASVSEEALDYLDAPIVRMAAKDTPTPFAKNLENYHFPQKEEIKNKLKELASF